MSDGSPNGKWHTTLGQWAVVCVAVLIPIAGSFFHLATAVGRIETTVTRLEERLHRDEVKLEGKMDEHAARLRSVEEAIAELRAIMRRPEEAQ